MSDLLESRWRISDQAIANAVADETVILHLGNGTYYGLDPIGARLWDALQAGETPASICPAVLDAYDVEEAQLQADLRDLLGDLVANDLIEPA
ncbi:PqqD family protein [Erythrobacter colymbi]|uniref:PqqD family protein n=1 Tax=Erythrobacter colymbi TaxID=1161202 RepID=UPI0013901863|nr:PqqD family protein [Erythrobacter colymbi]